ncbi:hypothetical protein SDC9_124683 [bioreactor metagenome]|uniref:Uncharacterized protein n=1 Tax=bioreactor metagenome TaxID=1076179 RepID=A0A645CL63_9ZZZZ
MSGAGRVPRCRPAAAGTPARRIRNRAARRPSISSTLTSTRRSRSGSSADVSSASVTSPTAGMAPSRNMNQPARVSYGPSGSTIPVSSSKSSSEVSPSISLVLGAAGVASSTMSYSSVISPTSSSTRSSIVTMPAVPPYSSRTIAMWLDTRRISASA